jgi:GNAT superfamily N-acetyltransferase
LPPSEEDLLFIEDYKSALKLKNGKIMEVRPLLPSDEFAIRNFFYSLEEHTIYLRFFYDMKLFSHEVAQMEWSKVDYRKNISLVGLIQTEGHKEIKAIGSYAKGSRNFAEVAFVVSEDYQGMGISSYLLEKLEEIAKKNKYKGFTANVMKENMPMLRVFRKRYPDAQISLTETDEYRIIMSFSGRRKPEKTLSMEIVEKIQDELRDKIESEFEKKFWNDFENIKEIEFFVGEVLKNNIELSEAAKNILSKWLEAK